MILVNLLPQELRPKETKQIHIPYRAITLGIFSIFILLSLYHLFLFVRVRGQYRALAVQWTGLAERSTQAEQLEKEMGTTILAEVDFYDTLVDPSLETAKVLNLTSDLLPKSVWLTNLQFTRDGRTIELVLNGLSASGGRASKLVEIQNFANGLKKQMEESIGFQPSSNKGTGKPIEVFVTTASQKGEAGKAELIQFVATLRSEKINQKP